MHVVFLGGIAARLRENSAGASRSSMEKWRIESGPIIWPFKFKEARSWQFPCRHLPVTRADSEGGTTLYGLDHRPSTRCCPPKDTSLCEDVTYQLIISIIMPSHGWARGSDGSHARRGLEADETSVDILGVRALQVFVTESPSNHRRNPTNCNALLQYHPQLILLDG